MGVNASVSGILTGKDELGPPGEPRSQKKCYGGCGYPVPFRKQGKLLGTIGRGEHVLIREVLTRRTGGRRRGRPLDQRPRWGSIGPMEKKEQQRTRSREKRAATQQSRPSLGL